MATARQVRTVRVPDELWEKAQSRAETEYTTVSAVIIEALRRYIAKPKDG